MITSLKTWRFSENNHVNWERIDNILSVVVYSIFSHLILLFISVFYQRVDPIMWDRGSECIWSVFIIL